MEGSAASPISHLTRRIPIDLGSGRCTTLFVHKNFPAQFGHIGARGVAERGWTATFVSEKPPGEAGGVRNVQYRPRGGRREARITSPGAFENGIWHAAGVYGH
ncbi:MAG: hypothetical protein M9964_10700 [Solirubrobacterales bacterium]|nr:hypothetical protein [Solirubrobacterales bacterium]